LAPGRPTADGRWVALESVHAVTYFAPTCRQVLSDAGLKGFWAGYFAARAAPLGAVEGGPVVAAFYNFHPAMVQKAIPACWDVVDPARLALDRAAAAAHALELLDCAELVHALPSLRAASARCPTEGRMLAAANQALGPTLEVGLGQRWTSPPVLALAEVWQACTTLREHRGDGHAVALLTHGLSGLEAHLLASAALGLAPEVLRDNRGWTAPEWEDGRRQLEGRGFIGADGAATGAGQARRQSVETMTDDLAETAFAGLGDQEVRTLYGALLRGARRIQFSGLLPFPNPMGLPALDGTPGAAAAP
jgi:hypothetical protein